MGYVIVTLIAIFGQALVAFEMALVVWVLNGALMATLFTGWAKLRAPDEGLPGF